MVYVCVWLGTQWKRQRRTERKTRRSDIESVALVSCVTLNEGGAFLLAEWVFDVDVNGDDVDGDDEKEEEDETTSVDDGLGETEERERGESMS